MGKYWKHIKHYFKTVDKTKALMIVVMAVFVLVVGTYGAWKLERYISPESGISGDDTKGRIQIKASVIKDGGGGLSNDINGTDTPDYGNTNALEVKAQGGRYVLPRLEGTVYYQ
jgi:hypothetical protein